MNIRRIVLAVVLVSSATSVTAQSFLAHERLYQVNTAQSATLLDSGGLPFDVSKSYYVRAMVTDTSRKTGAVAFFHGGNTEFSLTQLYETFRLSNDVEFFLDAQGKPAVRLYNHTNIFKVKVWTEEYSNRGRVVGPQLNLYSNGAGNVGIGTTAPTTRLHVSGDTRIDGDLVVSGSLGAKYQDLAEWVPSTQDLRAGMVVVVDPSALNGVVPSQRSYDTGVAGVVSPQPGIMLGEPAPGSHLIATTGRVRVRVDASVHPIRAGDLLVTSDMSGVAMASQPIEIDGRAFHQPGTLIGKALEPLDTGTGEILVLLSLQ